MMVRIPPLLAALLLSAYSHAFVPSIRYPFSPHPRIPSSLCSMTTENEQSTLNRQLDQLARKCGNPQEHVILLASQCEDLFHASPNVDIVSFNTVLKAWAKTCAALAEQSKSFHVATIVGSSEIPSVPVYTARDAAERATNLLLEMERTAEEDPEATIVPDTASYNSVIGMLPCCVKCNA